MAAQTGTTLKTYFNTGDQPTEAQFVNLIDSSLNLTDGGTVAGASKFTHVNGLVASRTLQAVANVAPTDISATALSVNTYYKSIAAATAMTIPSAAAGAIGDFISIYYSVAIGNGNAHSYTTTTDTAYTLGSTAVRIGGAVASKGDLSVAADNVLTITGHTNGDGGLGTTVRFVNVTGAAQGWAVEAITTNQGNGSQAGTIAFS
tara:strand:+ start:262 stop:873 length:612 start_codon:yes stop_codon:yes gene_type:complete